MTEMTSMGIEVEYRDHTGWYATAQFKSRGQPKETMQGKIETRYAREEIAEAVDAVVNLAEAMGVTFLDRSDIGSPSITYLGDGEWQGYPPPANWQQITNEQSLRLGWIPSYTQEEEETA